MGGGGAAGRVLKGCGETCREAGRSGSVEAKATGQAGGALRCGARPARCSVSGSPHLGRCPRGESPRSGPRPGRVRSAGLCLRERCQCGALTWAPGHARRGRPRRTRGPRSGTLAGARPALHSAPGPGAQRWPREPSAGQGGVPASGECTRVPLAAAARCPAGQGSRIPAAGPEGEAAPPPHGPRTTRRMRATGARRTKETDDRRAAISDCGHPRGQSRQPCAPRDPCRLRPPVHNSPGGAAPGEEEPRALAPGAPWVLIGPGTPRQHPHLAPPTRSPSLVDQTLSKNRVLSMGCAVHQG